MKREIDYAGIKSMFAYYLDTKDEALLQKAIEAFLFVYNKNNEFDKLLPTVALPSGYRVFGEKIKIEGNKTYVDGRLVTQDGLIYFSGHNIEVEIDNNQISARPIHIHGDFRNGTIKARSFWCDSVSNSSINVEGDMHSDDVNYCPEIKVGGKLACDNINHAANITVGDKIDATGQIIGQIISGKIIDAPTVKYERYVE